MWNMLNCSTINIKNIKNVPLSTQYFIQATDISNQRSAQCIFMTSVQNNIIKQINKSINKSIR